MKRIIVIVFAGLLLFSGNAFGTEEENIIYGCYQKENGQLRLVSDPGECKKSENSISWPGNTTQNSICRDTKTITVDCSQDETINEALESACPGDTILVTGSCYESIVLKSPFHDRIVIDGQGSATINGGDDDVIRIDGAQGVILREIPSLCGYRGIYALRGAAFEANNVEIQNAAYRGIQIIENSTATFNNLTVENSNNDGINIGYESSAMLYGMIKSNNNGIAYQPGY